MKDTIVIITGGTFNKVAPHLALAAVAYGNVGDEINRNLNRVRTHDVWLVKTRMASCEALNHASIKDAGLKSIEINEDLSTYIRYINTLPNVKVVIMACAVCDFMLDTGIEGRLDSSKPITVTLVPSEKILPKIREDIYTISFKTLYNDPDNLDKINKNLDHCDLVFVNDIGTKQNGLSNDNQFKWFDTRSDALKGLCYSVLNHLKLDNAKCSRCGIQEPVYFKEAIERPCDCGTRKRSLMSYATILKYKYDFTC